MDKDQRFDQGIEWFFAVCRYELRSLSNSDKDCLKAALKSLKQEWHNDGLREAYKESSKESGKVKGKLAEQKTLKGRT